MQPNNILTEKPLLLFDGVCNLCNVSVQFVIKHDPSGKIMFTSLQSERGQAILKQLNMKTDDFDTFVFIENGIAYTRSTGILRGVKHFEGWWKILYGFIIIPRPIRDFIYNTVAQNRYRWFGKKNECWLPSPELKKRFL